MLNAPAGEDKTLSAQQFLEEKKESGEENNLKRFLQSR
jgi:hypothetical protein